jgi:hypothetical protein
VGFRHAGRDVKQLGEFLRSNNRGIVMDESTGVVSAG